MESEALVARTAGEIESITMLADAHLHREKQKAAGIQTVYQAQAQGLQDLYAACNSNAELVKFYLANESGSLTVFCFCLSVQLCMTLGLYEALAKENAQAVQGLNPKLNVWNTGLCLPDHPEQPHIL